jgi:hypothetical protein
MRRNGHVRFKFSEDEVGYEKEQLYSNSYLNNEITNQLFWSYGISSSSIHTDVNNTYDSYYEKNKDENINLSNHELCNFPSLNPNILFRILSFISSLHSLYSFCLINRKAFNILNQKVTHLSTKFNPLINKIIFNEYKDYDGDGLLDVFFYYFF